MMEYPRRKGRTIAAGRSRDEARAVALAYVIEQMDAFKAGKPPLEPQLSECKLAEHIYRTNYITSLNHPPLPEHIIAARKAANAEAWSKYRKEREAVIGRTASGYYGGDRTESRPGQILGD